jgi:signal transduction histidine kinase
MGTMSIVVVPLRIQGAISGTLSLTRDAGHSPYTTDDLILLENLAERVVLAIQNAHLYEALEKALAQEQIVRQQLIQAEKFAAMGRMLASVAHELNNPLQTIKNCLYLTRQDTPPDSPIQEFLDMAVSETGRLSNLVAQLRELYKPRMADVPQDYDLRQILDDAHTLLEPQLQNLRVQWIQKPAPEGLRVHCVADQIKQVIINICTNAMEAMQPDGGSLVVHLVRSEDASEVGLRFQDTGPGISPEAMQNLFEPFFTTKTGGLGLGLSICYELVQRNKGTILVESQVGQGTIFTIWLPLNKE